MTDNQTAAPADQPVPDAAAATSFRRAAAFLAHVLAGDQLGYAAVLDEVRSDPEFGEDALLGALVRLMVELRPDLVSPEGVAYLRRLASSFAAEEGERP